MPPAETRPKTRSFVVVCPQGLGDTLEATPLLAALRKSEPDATLTVIVLRAQARDLLCDIPGLVDRVVYLPYWERGTPAFATAMLRFLLSAPEADVAFLTYAAARPIYLAMLLLIRCKKRIAHRYSKSIFRALCSVFVKQIGVRPHHNVLRNMDLASAAGMPTEPPTGYVVPPGWRAPSRNAGNVLMHVGTVAHHGLEARRWPEASFADLGRRLIARGCSIEFISGPGETEATARVAQAVPGSTIFTGTLTEVARLLASAKGVVANDNGIAHLAAGVGAPVLALHGPTPIEHGPFGRGAVPFRPSPCPPCFDVLHTDTRCKLDIDYACLKRDLSVDTVERRFLAMLEEHRS